MSEFRIDVRVVVDTEEDEVVGLPRLAAAVEAALGTILLKDKDPRAEVLSIRNTGYGPPNDDALWRWAR